MICFWFTGIDAGKQTKELKCRKKEAFREKKK
jgi:hypothetical protein